LIIEHITSKVRGTKKIKKTVVSKHFYYVLSENKALRERAFTVSSEPGTEAALIRTSMPSNHQMKVC
jgi:hypothetical protein